MTLAQGLLKKRPQALFSRLSGLRSGPWGWLLAIGLCLTVPGCQQTQIQFTPGTAPQLPEFNRLQGAPAVSRLTPVEPEAVQIVALDSGHSLHLFSDSASGLNHLRLVAISPRSPLMNIDVILEAFSARRDWIAANHPLACSESLVFAATLHSISVGIDCQDAQSEALGLLVSFWQPGAFDELDIANIRRQLKLAKHINAYSGAEIDTLWAKKILGETHPYNLALDDRQLADDLSLERLNRLQHEMLSQVDWALLADPATVRRTEFISAASQKMQALPARNAVKNSVNNLAGAGQVAAEAGHSKTLYLIHAPGSVQTQVRVGYRLAPGTTDSSPMAIRDELSCRLLASWLGRSFSGRLFFDLREKRGLTYGIHGRCFDNPLARTLKFYGSTKLEHSGAFISGIVSHLSLAAAESPSPGELASIQTHELSKGLLRRASPRQKESDYIEGLIWGYDANHDYLLEKAIASLDVRQLQQMAREVFSRPPLIVVRGDSDKILADLRDKLPEWDIRLTTVD